MQCKRDYTVQSNPKKRIHSSQSEKYLFNLIQKIFIQSNPKNLFNPIRKKVYSI